MSSPNSRYPRSNSHLSPLQRLRAIEERINQRTREELDVALGIALGNNLSGAARNKRYHDMYYAGVMNQCRDEDVQICDDTLSALNHRAGLHGPHVAGSEPLRELLEAVRNRVLMYPPEASVRGPNTARNNDGREESLEIHPWNMDEVEYDEDDDEDEDEEEEQEEEEQEEEEQEEEEQEEEEQEEEEQEEEEQEEEEENDDEYDEYDGGFWMHKDERMSDFEDEEEYDEDEDEDGEADYDEDYPNDFRGHGGHGQDLEDSLMGRRLGTPPTNDREGTAVLIKESQQGAHACQQNDTGYLLQVGLLPHAMVEAGPGAVTRVLRVPTRMTFQQLAETINTAFDWDGRYHAYEFKLCKPCRKRLRCMCELCEPIVAKFNQLVMGIARVDEWAEQFYTNFDADKVALSDVWGHDACRGMNVWYRYDFGANWQHLIHFLGEADSRLGPAMALPRSQEIWCLSGEGHPWPEDMQQDMMEWAGRAETNLYEWDREAVNKELRKLKI